MTNYEIESREWWAQQWVDLLETSRFKKRLERARLYAHQGNVLSIDFERAEVLARVQGTEAKPYQVSLSLDAFSDEEWGYVIDSLSHEAIFSAQLLAGEMPANIQKAFSENGLSLFPYTLSEIHARCSCPDQQVPCKHIGAVYYLLGDRFSEDPFVMFQLRGRTKEQILEALRQIWRASSPPIEEEPTEIPQIDTTRQANPLKIEEFWQYDEPLDSTLVVITPAATNDTILDVLGSISLPLEEAGTIDPEAIDTVMQYLNNIYQAVSQQAFLSALNREQ